MHDQFMKNLSCLRVLAAVSLCILSACSEKKTELQRQEQLVKEQLENRKVDLARKVVVAESQQFASRAELEKICDEFMALFGKGQLDQAFDILDKHSPWPKPEMRALREQTKSQLAMVEPRFGTFVGYEQISITPVGDSVVKCLYLAKLKNHGLRCMFLFYRAEDRWTLNMFVWDDKITLLE